MGLVCQRNLVTRHERIEAQKVLYFLKVVVKVFFLSYSNLVAYSIF